MASVSKKLPRFPNNNFVKLQNQCGKKGYDVLLSLDDDKVLWIEIIQPAKDTLISPAEQIRPEETVEKACDRIYKRLVKEGIIEPQNRSK